MSGEDPKAVAKAELKRPETQRLLRQFLKVDGPKGVTDKYRRGHELAFETNKHRLDCSIWDSMESECDCGGAEARREETRRIVTGEKP